METVCVDYSSDDTGHYSSFTIFANYPSLSVFCIYFLHRVYCFLATNCLAYSSSKGKFCWHGTCNRHPRIGQMPAASLSAKPFNRGGNIDGRRQKQSEYTTRCRTTTGWSGWTAVAGPQSK